MKRGRPRKNEDLKEKMILSEFLRFTVFVAEGAYGHLVSQTRRVILYLICLKFICTNILILMIKQKSLCVVSTCRPPARYNSCAIDCRPCPGSKDQTLPSRMVNLKRGCQVFLQGIQVYPFKIKEREVIELAFVKEYNILKDGQGTCCHLIVEIQVHLLSHCSDVLCIGVRPYSVPSFFVTN